MPSQRPVPDTEERRPEECSTVLGEHSESGSLLTTSVIVAVRNDPSGLAATLDGLERQTVRAEELHVVVVDDCSTDHTGDVAEARPNTEVIRLTSRGGSYAARNAGIEQSRGVYVAITDAGCIPAPGWIENATTRLTRSEMTVLAGDIRMPLGRRPSLAAMVDVVHHLDQQRYVEERGAAVTANLITTRAVFDAAGLFDSALPSSGDIEWVTRARAAGATLEYAKDVQVVHPPREHPSQLIRKSVRVARGGSIARAAGNQLSGGGRRPYGDPYTVVPRHRKRGKVRVVENGASPGRVRWLLVGVAQIVLVQLPQAIAALYFDLRSWPGRVPREP